MIAKIYDNSHVPSSNKCDHGNQRPIHNIKKKRWGKDGCDWYSHKVGG